MERWLIRGQQALVSSVGGQLNPSPCDSHDSDGLTADGQDGLDNGSSYTLMSDESNTTDAHAPSMTKRVGFTAINQPWKRDSYNATLFDSCVLGGADITAHANGYGTLSRVGNGQRVESASEFDEEQTFAEGEEDLQDEQNEAANGNETHNIDHAALHAECEIIFSADPKLLTNERLLCVAGLFTNAEIVETVKLHHPNMSLPARITNMTQTLSDTITRVASKRGVPREAVKKEVDGMREVTGVFQRQTVYNAAKARERREAKKRAMEAEPMEVDGAAETDDRGMSTEDTERVDSGGGESIGSTKGITPTPYGLGSSSPAQEKEVMDSEDDDEEL